MNVHKRCQKNVANNCGLNTKQLAEILSLIGIDPNKPCKSKVSKPRTLEIHWGTITAFNKTASLSF